MELVDTDVLIDVQRGHAPALTWFTSLSVLPSVPGFVVMELIQDARNSHEVRKALKLVAPLQIVWPTEPDYARHFPISQSITYHMALGFLIR